MFEDLILINRLVIYMRNYEVSLENYKFLFGPLHNVDEDHLIKMLLRLDQSRIHIKK